MITDLIIGLVSALLSGVLSALPAWTLPDQWTSTLPAQLGTWASWANGYFPLFDCGIALGILLGFRVVLAAWQIAVWVYERFPFKFT